MFKLFLKSTRFFTELCTAEFGQHSTGCSKISIIERPVKRGGDSQWRLGIHVPTSNR